MGQGQNVRSSEIRTEFMSQQVIKLSDNAASRIKEIMSKSDDSVIGVRVGVKSGGCAGMSYVMEYAKEVKKMKKLLKTRV